MSEDQKTQLELDREAAQKLVDESNAKLTGKGPRLFVGATRGRNTSIITFPQFDEQEPDTLPVNLGEFQELTKSYNNGEPYGNSKVMGYIITGWNDDQYKLASDEIGEFVNKAWPDDVQAQFRLAVRNYSKAVSCSIEDAVKLIRPGIEASQKKG